MFILDGVRLKRGFGAPARGFFERLARIVHPQGHDLYAVAVAAHVLRNFRVRQQRCCQHEPDFALLEHVGGPVAQAGFGAGVGHEVVAERGLIIVGRLLGVADVELNKVGAEQG